MKTSLKDLYTLSKSMDFDSFKQHIKSEISGQPITVVIQGELIVNIELIKEKRKLSPDMFKHFNEVISYFDKKTYSEKLWLECYDKLMRIDGYSEESILYVVKYFRNEDNWWYASGNFQTLLKLRRLNTEKVKYMDMFVAKIKAEHNATRKGFAHGNIIHNDDGKQRNY